VETPGRFFFQVPALHPFLQILGSMNPHPTRNRILTGISLLGVGAAGMYFFDPKLGAGRRAMARDRIRHYRREARKQSQAFARNVSDRTRGLIHEASERFLPTFLQSQRNRYSKPSDEKLRARALSRIGRVPHHEPRTFDIRAHEGCITVSGAIDEGDYQRLYRALRKIPGVRKVDRQTEAPDGQVVS
jgi:hypothetical protein